MNSDNSSSLTSQVNYDSDFCGSIPLNFINMVQPHGVLLVLSREDFTILQLSENSEDTLGAAPEALLNKPIGAIR